MASLNRFNFDPSRGLDLRTADRVLLLTAAMSATKWRPRQSQTLLRPLLPLLLPNANFLV
jgi:hypothetical protein